MIRSGIYQRKREYQNVVSGKCLYLALRNNKHCLSTNALYGTFLHDDPPLKRRNLKLLYYNFLTIYNIQTLG